MLSQHNKKFAKLSKHTRSRIMCMQIAKWLLIVALLHIVCTVCNVHISTSPIHPNKPLSLLFTSHCLHCIQPVHAGHLAKVIEFILAEEKRVARERRQG